MALTAMTTYAPQRDLNAVLIVAIIFGMINLPTVSSWTLLGQQMRRVLNHKVRLRVFNYTMAILLIASLYPILRA